VCNVNLGYETIAQITHVQARIIRRNGQRDRGQAGRYRNWGELLCLIIFGRCPTDLIKIRIRNVQEFLIPGEDRLS
jgi:hypothetical protein